ncbi:MAG: trypsin-like peptidase domain-containing protein [Pseudomonadota bacterium]
MHPARIRQTAVLLLLAGLLGACAGGGSSTTRSPALADLEAGRCPETIIFSGGQLPAEGKRYGRKATYTDLDNYRKLEIANCEQRLAAGDAGALKTLTVYWQNQKDPRREAEAYQIYLETGSDPEVKVAAIRTLYDLYSKGRPGLPADPEAAFYYMGQSVAYGDTHLRLDYADGLYSRKRYEEALGQYFEFQMPGLTVRQSEGFSKLQMCEVNLRLAEMYFKGRGTAKDPYLGYFFWQRGMDLADGPQWGSCYRDNFVYGNRYYEERERKQQIEIGMAKLSPSQVAELDRALAMPPEQGLAVAGSMAGGVGGRGTTRIERQSRVRYSTTSAGYRGWQGWQPLEGEICALSAPRNSLAWSDVFELRSTSVWSLKSASSEATSRGSAVAVAPDRLVTNCHLIQRPDSIELFQGSLRMRAQVTASDVEGDRCILAVNERMPSYVRAARPYGYLRVGEEVAAIGNPRGLDTSLSRGIVAQKRTNTGVSLIQTDAALSVGSSGGGLFDSAGNLVGITTFKVDDGENLNFAIAIDEFCR